MDARNVIFSAIWIALATSVSSVAPTSWRADYAPANTELTAIAYGGGQFVAVGRDTTIVRSLDGVHWTLSSYCCGGGADLFAIAYGNGRFVVGGESNALLMGSSDGVDWTGQMAVSGPAGAEKIYGLTFGNGRFLGVGSLSQDQLPLVLTSTNGTYWETPLRPTRATLRAVTYGHSMFVAVGDLGTIITSPDGFNWTLRTSGTQNTLRAVTFAGTRFIAGGDMAAIVFSTDGVSWAAGAPPAFNVTGLAAADGSVVAVGKYQNDGRYHVSADGITWPGNVQLAPQGLNGIAHLEGRFFALGNNGLILQSDATRGQLTNRWTKSTSGYWEEPYWSLGELPSPSRGSIVVVTNEGYKALAIGANTTANHADSLYIGSLEVDAPTNSHNLLLLNYAGLSVSLRIAADLYIGRNGSLLSYYSALQPFSLSVDGRATFAEYGQTDIRWVRIGLNNSAELWLSNGWFSVNQLDVGWRAPGLFHQIGGTNRVEGMFVRDNSSYHLAGGTLELPTTQMLRLVPEYLGGIARLNLTGGRTILNEGIWLGTSLGEYPGGRGEVLLAGGLFHSHFIGGLNGQFTQTGGTNETSILYFPSSFENVQAHVTYQLSGGLLISSVIGLGGVTPGIGYFVQTGGVHTNQGSVSASGTRDESHMALGYYNLHQGMLYTPWLTVSGGHFSQLGGSNRVSMGLTVSDLGRYNLYGGQLRSANAQLLSDHGTNAYQYSLFIQEGGEHIVEGLLDLEKRARYSLLNGSLSAATIRVGPESLFQFGREGTLQANDRLIMAGGALVPLFTRHFGALEVTSGGSSMEFNQGDSSIHFRDSHDIPWTGGTLFIRYWQHGMHGQRPHRIFVGTNAQGLTAAQLARITFVGPGGFPPGNYAARILDTGEVMPAPTYSISYRRTATGLELTWPEGYRLFSSTNLLGPYQPVPGTFYMSHTVLFTDPQRFFVIRSP